MLTRFTVIFKRKINSFLLDIVVLAVLKNDHVGAIFHDDYNMLKSCVICIITEDIKWRIGHSNRVLRQSLKTEIYNCTKTQTIDGRQ